MDGSEVCYLVDHAFKPGNEADLLVLGTECGLRPNTSFPATGSPFSIL